MRRKKRRGNWRRSCASKRGAVCRRLERRKRAGHRQLCRWPALFVWKGKGPAPDRKWGQVFFCWFFLPVMGENCLLPGGESALCPFNGSKREGGYRDRGVFSFAGRGEVGGRDGRSLSPRGPAAGEAGGRDGCGPSPGGGVERGRREVSAVFPWGLRRGKSGEEMARLFSGACGRGSRGERWVRPFSRGVRRERPERGERSLSPRGPVAGEVGRRDGCALFPGTCAGEAEERGVRPSRGVCVGRSHPLLPVFPL